MTMASNIFDAYRAVRPERHSQDIGNEHITDCRSGDIVPIDFYECIPGDRFNMASHVKIRLDPLVNPAYTHIKGKIRSHFVPYRIIWKNFDKFFTGGRTGKDFTPIPVINMRYISKVGFNTLFDYFRLPVGLSDTGQVDNYINAFYFLAYIKIWNDYFRNPSIDVEIDVLESTIYKFDGSSKTYTHPIVDIGDDFSGADVTLFFMNCLGFMNGTFSSNDPDWPLASYTSSIAPSDTISSCARINYARDYFTSSLPTPIHGDAPVIPVDVSSIGSISSPDISVPLNYTSLLSGKHVLYGSGSSIFGSPTTVSPTALSAKIGSSSTTGSDVPITPASHDHSLSSPNVGGSPGVNIKQIADKFSVSGSFSAGFVWNELRIVAQKTVFQEQLNYSGSRYVDALFAIFGVSPDDKTSDRAQFIGGFNVDIYTSEVLQTSETASTPLGSLGGHGIGSDYRHIGSKFIDEFGCIITNFYINNQPLYSQGIRKEFLKRSILDYAIPMFVNLQDEAVLTKELYYTGSTASDTKIFGFQGKYNEYRYTPNCVTGTMRPTANPDGWSNKEWTQARLFSNVPVLSSSFIKQDASSSNRIFADLKNKPQYNILYNAFTIAFRPLPKIANPGLIDHLGV
ncbi:major capsid protein [Peromfec virus RodF8_42]|uniref:Major capsid protein n=1 Tax=Peromfec virus RodF8_42 TaxID=2929375 RepID=A0A976N217_9VIRU|nr:major capsid protein [Peromfec virus RodF8_42]